MPDSYQLPALVLTVLLLPAFCQLYLRFRNARTLLWFLGFLFACIRMLQIYKLGIWDYTSPSEHPWMVARWSNSGSHQLGVLSGVADATSVPARSGAHSLRRAIHSAADRLRLADLWSVCGRDAKRKQVPDVPRAGGICLCSPLAHGPFRIEAFRGRFRYCFVSFLALQGCGSASGWGARGR